MKTIFFGDSETSLFFELQGIETRVVNNEAEFIDEFRKIRRQKTYGLLIVTAEVASFAKSQIDSIRFSKELPIIVEVSSLKGDVHTGKNLSNYIQEAIGIKI